MTDIFAEIKGKSTIFAAAIGLMVLVSSIIASAQETDGIQSVVSDKLTSTGIPLSLLVIAIGVVMITFVSLIITGCRNDGNLDQGEMRRAIAGTFVVGFTVLMFILSAYDIRNKEIINAYVQMVGVIVGFYFGAKTAMAGAGARASSEGPHNIPDVQKKGDNQSESPMETRNEI